MLYERPPLLPVPPGAGFRVIIAVASLMRSLGAQLAMFSMATLANLMLEPFAPSLALPRRVGMSLLAALPELLIFLGVTWILLRYLHRASLREIGFPPGRDAVRELALFGFGGAVAVSLTVLPLVALGGGAFRQSEPRIQSWATAALCVGLLALAAAAEEVLARGYGFQTLVQPLHWTGALLVSNGVFAALHMNNRNANEFSIANTFLAGCVLGMLLMVRQNLWAPIGAHFGWNLATPLLGVNLSGLPLQLTRYSIEWRWDPHWTGGGYGPEAGVPCTVLLSALLLFLLRLHFQRDNSNPWAAAN